MKYTMFLSLLVVMLPVLYLEAAEPEALFDSPISCSVSEDARQLLRMVIPDHEKEMPLTEKKTLPDTWRDDFAPEKVNEITVYESGFPQVATALPDMIIEDIYYSNGEAWAMLACQNWPEELISMYEMFAFWFMEPKPVLIDIPEAELHAGDVLSTCSLEFYFEQDALQEKLRDPQHIMATLESLLTDDEEGREALTIKLVSCHIGDRGNVD